MTSFLKRISSRGSSDALSSLQVPGQDDDDDRSGHRSIKSRGRSLSPFRRKKQHSPSNSLSTGRRDQSAEGLRRDSDHESDIEESRTPVVRPSNAFDDGEEEDNASDSEFDYEDHGDDEEVIAWKQDQEIAEALGWDSGDEELEKNTEANASSSTPGEFLTKEGLDMTFPGEGPNLVHSSTTPGIGSTGAGTGSTTSATNSGLLRRKSTKSSKLLPLKLEVGRPIFEKNRCTIILTHGNPEEAGKGRRTRTYLVASDLSEESLYAIEWAIGTVLREGDNLMIVSVIETDSKFDPETDKPSSSEKKAKINNQRERQANCLNLSRQATTLLEKTRLNVTVTCQAIHAKVPRHMLVDMIDYLQPTMVIVGTRGLTRIKGMLLGSVSNYLLSKSSCPVMVTRRPLRLSRTTHRKLSSLNREARIPLSQAGIESESKGGANVQDEDEPDDVKELVEKMGISQK